ncbi:MAG: hypothetical protein EPN21_06305 [Methylococcaceae bacterium]|nr:MAG: hypothetical protein EPN21_06305 [Methylococcaceae bacterium]
MGYPYTERLRGYRQEVDFCLELGEGPTLRRVREDIAVLALTPEEQAELVDIDAGAVEFVVSLDDVAPYLLQDDPAQPLSHWWWHLGKIRAGTYPADLLPPHLRAVYTELPQAA